MEERNFCCIQPPLQNRRNKRNKKKNRWDLQRCQTGCRRQYRCWCCSCDSKLYVRWTTNSGCKTGNHAQEATIQRREQSHRLGRRNESKTQPGSRTPLSFLFQRSRRTWVFLSGEAFFDIWAWWCSQPVSISLLISEITDLGTSLRFEILFKCRCITHSKPADWTPHHGSETRFTAWNLTTS